MILDVVVVCDEESVGLRDESVIVKSDLLEVGSITESMFTFVAETSNGRLAAGDARREEKERTNFVKARRRMVM